MERTFALVDLIQQFSENENAVESINDWCREYISVSGEEAILELNKAVHVAQKRGYQRGLGWVYYWLGTISIQKSDTDSGLRYFFNSLEIFETVGILRGMLEVAQELERAYSQLGIYESSLEWASYAYERAIRLNDSAAQKSLLVRSGEAYFRMKRVHEAHDCLVKAQKLPFHYVRTEIQFYILLGVVKLELELLAESDAAFERAMALSKKFFHPDLTIHVCLERARLKFVQGDEGHAKKDLHEALAYAQKQGDYSYYVRALIQRALFEEFKGYPKRSLTALQRALVVAEENALTAFQSEIHRTISRIYERSQSKKALEHFKKHHILEQEISNERNLRSILRLREDHNSRVAAAYKSRFDQVAVISKIGREITSTLDFSQVLELIYQHVQRLMTADIFGVALYSKEKQSLDYALFLEEGRRTNVGLIPVDSPRSLGAYCFRNSQTVLINDFETEHQKYVLERTVLSTREPRSMIFCPLVAASGTVGILSVQAWSRNAYAPHHGDTLGALASYISIALENARLFKEVQDLASHDPLTGLLNRRSLFEFGRREWEKHARYGQPLCVILIDLDHFKKVNDKYGHDVGDAVLLGVAEILGESLREVDAAGRYGGEEFLVVLPETHVTGAWTAAQRYRSKMEDKTFYLQNKKALAGITLSAGVYQFTSSQVSWEEGIRYADQALYQAKRGGRNQVYVSEHSPLPDEVV